MYQYHCENLRKIEVALEHIERDLKSYIAREQDGVTYTYTKILSYLIICWTEVRVCKLAYEPKAFTAQQIDDITHADTLKDKWVMALDYAICKAYGVSASKLDRLPFTVKARYDELVKIIDTQLAIAITVRNKIAHGQWLYAFNNDLKGINSKVTGDLRQENLLSLRIKLNMFQVMAQIINDLSVSKPTFERDFDTHYRVIQMNAYRKRSYPEYVAWMVKKYREGLKQRPNKNSAPSP